MIDGAPARVARSATPYGRLGPTGSCFGVVELQGLALEGRLRDRGERNYSTAGRQWLDAELAEELPNTIRLWLGEFDEQGHRSGTLDYSEVLNHAASADWPRMWASLPESDVTDAATGGDLQRRWLAALFRLADRFNPGYGHIGYHHGDGATALECTRN